MTIVLNERDWAEDMIMSRSLGKKPFETLRRVARYYIDNGIPKKQVRRLLDSFMIQCDPTASLTKWTDSLDRAVSFALKHNAINIESIDITGPEMKAIDALGGKQIRRLAFTLLCLAKYWNAITGKTDGWVNSKDVDIIRMANINTSIKRQSLMYFNLREAGMIEFSRRVDNTSVRVCFIEDGDVIMRITDFRNLGYQYMMYHGEPYFVCQNCGITTKIDNPAKGRKPKYCKACAAEVAIQKRVNNAMRIDMAGRKREEKKQRVYMHEFPNGYVYIGTTSQALKDRWKNGSGYNGTSVGDAIQEYGWENVKHYILFEGADKDTARIVESFMIRKTKAYAPEHGYNVREKSLKTEDDVDVDGLLCMKEVDGNGNEIKNNVTADPKIKPGKP